MQEARGTMILLLALRPDVRRRVRRAVKNAECAFPNIDFPNSMKRKFCFKSTQEELKLQRCSQNIKDSHLIYILAPSLKMKFKFPRVYPMRMHDLGDDEKRFACSMGKFVHGWEA